MSTTRTRNPRSAFNDCTKETHMPTGRAWLFVAFLLAMLLLATCNVWAQGTVKDDAYVTSTSSTTNNGASTSLVVQSGGSNSYIRFDLSRIPTVANGASTPITSSMVSKATMRLFVTAVTANGNFDVLEIGGTSSSQNWSESTITYSSQSSYTSFPKTLATGVPVSYPTPNSKNQYIIIDITPAVKDWLDNLNGAGGQYNNGIILKPSTGSSISVAFSSKEDTTSSHDPELNIVFDTSLSQISGTIGPSQVSAGTYGINISGGAGTASSFDHPPAQCGSNLFATGITAGGNANCLQPSAGNLTNGASGSGAVLLGSSPVMTNATINQAAAGNDALAGKRASDTTTTGNLEHFTNAAGNSDLWRVDATGTLQAGTVPGARISGGISGANINNGSIPIAALANNSVTINTPANSGLSGGGNVALGGSLTLNNTGVLNVGQGTGILLGGTAAQPIINNAGVLSFNGRNGTVTPQTGDYTFAQLSGTAATTQLPGTVVYTNQPNIFGAGNKQTFLASLTGTAGLGLGSGIAGDPQTKAAGDMWFNTLSGVNRPRFYDGTTVQSLAFSTDVTAANASITAETNRATAAENTLTSNLNMEIANRQVGDSTTLSTAESFATSAVNTEVTNRNAAISTAVNGVYSGNNTFTGTNSFTGTKVDLSGAGATFPVRTIVGAPPTGSNICAAGQMVLQKDAPAGQQLFICNAALNGWVMVNDDTATVTSDKAYTDTQIAAEKTRAMAAEGTLTTNLSNEVTRATGAESAEAATRAAADTTLQANINNEASARAAAVTAEANRATGVEGTLTTNLAAEATARAAADTVLSASISNESTRATAAEGALTTNLSAEATRAQAAENAGAGGGNKSAEYQGGLGEAGADRHERGGERKLHGGERHGAESHPGLGAAAVCVPGHRGQHAAMATGER